MHDTAFRLYSINMFVSQYDRKPGRNMRAAPMRKGSFSSDPGLGSLDRGKVSMN